MWSLWSEYLRHSQRLAVNRGGEALRLNAPQHLGHSLLLVLLLLKAPVVVGLPSLSFSWFSQSMFNDLQDRGEREGL